MPVCRKPPLAASTSRSLRPRAAVFLTREADMVTHPTIQAPLNPHFAFTKAVALASIVRDDDV
jgi:hypothetical protein